MHVFPHVRHVGVHFWARQLMHWYSKAMTSPPGFELELQVVGDDDM